MRIYVSLACLSFFLFYSANLSAQHKKRIPFYELDIIRGLFFQPNTIAPYTGTGFEEFADGRKKMQVPIKDGKVNGILKEWEVNGQKVFQAEYNMGVQTGVEIQWFANGQKSLEIPYQNGKADGLCLEWYKHGRKKSEGQFVNGKEEGEHNWWFFNGQKDQHLIYKNGKAEGLVTNWYQTGQLKLESDYQNGLKNGKITRWHGNGQKHTEGHYLAGKEDGEEHTWSKSGLLEGIKFFEQGSLVKEYNYRSGNIFMGKSYLQVVNEKESFFTLEIKGESVFPRWTNGISSYSVDGYLLQVFNYPISNFTTESTSVEEAELLEFFQKNESEILRKKYATDLDISQKLIKRTDGKSYLYWRFPIPADYKQRKGSKKIMEEHFVSIICHKQVLNIHSLLMEGENPAVIQQLLKQVVETVKTEEERIDLNSILTILRNK